MFFFKSHSEVIRDWLLDVAVDEIFAAVDHPLAPLLPGEDLEAVLALLRHLDIHQQKLVLLYPVASVSFLATLLLNKNRHIF